MAEGVGFEPTEVLPSTVFKTAAFDHSAIPPRIYVYAEPLFLSSRFEMVNIFVLSVDRFNFLWFRGRNIGGEVMNMKQKYTIVRDDKNKQLIIREFAELDKEILSLLCEETYDQKLIRAAIKSGKEKLIAALRTNNLYPPGIYADKIANAVKELYASKAKESEDLFFNDLELLAKESEAEAVEEELERDSEDLDEVLEEDFESGYEDKEQLNKMNPSLKIADDEYEDGNGET